MQPRQLVWDDLDKKKYYFWGTTLFLGIRVFIYPTNLIATRLQVQQRKDVYRGLYDAFFKVFKSEGIAGFYRGFHIYAMKVVFGQVYITTYEYTKHKCQDMNLAMQGLVAGSVASIAGQSLSVPADIVTQRLQIEGMKRNHIDGNILTGTNKRAQESVVTVCRKIIKYDGMSGFYRGFFISLVSNVPNSAIWWASYNLFLRNVGQHFEADSIGTHKLHVQAFCGMLSGVVSALATNPFEVVRTRIQVGRSRSLIGVTKKLWADEGYAMLLKGLTARTVSMSTSSFLNILGYETVKRISYNNREIEHPMSGKF